MKEIINKSVKLIERLQNIQNGLEDDIYDIELFNYLLGL